MRIYTKTGDAGETGLIGGERVPKQSARIDAIGDVDELNATIGLARVHSGGKGLDKPLSKIQNWLFELGAELATPPSTRFINETIAEEHVAYLEESIDAQTANLPELSNFVLPAGSPLAASLHHSRTVCRRAERSILKLANTTSVRRDLLRFVNRLSDWLFVAARTANAASNVEDTKWNSEGV